MSRNTTIITASVLLAFGLIWIIYPAQSVDYDPKMIQLRPQNEKIRFTQKLKLPINVKFEVLGDEVVPGREFTVIVTIYPDMNVRGAAAQWRIPKGIEILSEKNLNLGDLLPHEPKLISARFRQLSQKNEKIHLVMTSKLGAQKIHTQFQFNSLDNKIIMENAKDLALRHEQYIFDHPELLKVQE